MEQIVKSNSEKKRLLEARYRKAVLSAKEAQISDDLYHISKIANLEFLAPNGVWEIEGTTSFNSIAEIFFEVNNDCGGEYSNGDRFKISGQVNRTGEDFSIIEPLIIQDPGIINHILNKGLLKEVRR